MLTDITQSSKQNVVSTTRKIWMVSGCIILCFLEIIYCLFCGISEMFIVFIEWMYMILPKHAFHMTHCICMLLTTIRSMVTLYSSVVRGYFQSLFFFIPWLFHFFLIISGFVHIQRVIYYIKRNIRFHGYSHTICNPMVWYGYILNYDNIAYNQTSWEKYKIHTHMTSRLMRTGDLGEENFYQPLSSLLNFTYFRRYIGISVVVNVVV